MTPLSRTIEALDLATEPTDYQMWRAEIYTMYRKEPESDDERDKVYEFSKRFFPRSYWPEKEDRPSQS